MRFQLVFPVLPMGETPRSNAELRAEAADRFLREAKRRGITIREPVDIKTSPYMVRISAECDVPQGAPTKFEEAEE